MPDAERLALIKKTTEAMRTALIDAYNARFGVNPGLVTDFVVVVASQHVHDDGSYGYLVRCLDDGESPPWKIDGLLRAGVAEFGQYLRYLHEDDEEE
jgi:hypothetical protein